MNHPSKYFLLICILLGYHHLHGQDTLFLRDGHVIVSKIIYADHDSVRIKYWDRPNGPDYVYSRYELKRIKYENGNEVFYKFNLEQSAIGISFGRDAYSSNQIGDGYAPSITSLNDKSVELSYLYRGNVIGFAAYAGYSHLVTYSEYYINNVMPPYNVGTAIDTLTTNTFQFLFSLRLNTTNHKKINPYFFFSFGLESYTSYSPINNAVITRYGIGLELCFLKQWLIEPQLGFGTRGDLGNRDQSGQLNLYGHLGFNVYRLIASKYEHEK